MSKEKIRHKWQPSCVHQFRDVCEGCGIERQSLPTTIVGSIYKFYFQYYKSDGSFLVKRPDCIKEVIKHNQLSLL
jgi:hypothetical protein